jgi:hypothetical protein
MKNSILKMLAIILISCLAAFANAPKLAGSVYGNTSSGNDNYTLRMNLANPLLCAPSPRRPCFYVVTEVGADYVAGLSYTYSELELFVTLGYVIRSTRNGIYYGD